MTRDAPSAGRYADLTVPGVEVLENAVGRKTGPNDETFSTRERQENPMNPRLTQRGQDEVPHGLPHAPSRSLLRTESAAFVPRSRDRPRFMPYLGTRLFTFRNSFLAGLAQHSIATLSRDSCIPC
jgi:hypothetical protein